MVIATALILSYNRQDSLRRQLIFYENKRIHLILADGSDEDWGSGEFGSIGEMSWEYFRIPGNDSYVPRLRMAISKVKTEYLFFLDDEECILWTGIESAIRFLRENHDHSCASGRVDWMGLVDSELAIGSWGRWSKQLALTQTDAIERLSIVGRTGRTANLFYVVMRSREARNFTQGFDWNFSMDAHSLIFIELYLASFLALAGKWEMGTYPFWIRYSKADTHVFSNKSNDLLPGEALEMQEMLKRALSFGSRECAGYSFENGSNEIAETLDRYFGSIKFSENQIRNDNEVRLPNFYEFKKYFKSALVKLYLILLKQFCPRTYKLRPRALVRFRRFAKNHGKGSESVNNEVLQVARLWTRYPSGVGVNDLTEVLRPKVNCENKNL